MLGTQIHPPSCGRRAWKKSWRKWNVVAGVWTKSNQDAQPSSAHGQRRSKVDSYLRDTTLGSGPSSGSLPESLNLRRLEIWRNLGLGHVAILAPRTRLIAIFGTLHWTGGFTESRQPIDGGLWYIQRTLSHLLNCRAFIGAPAKYRLRGFS
jgi:hypothetical protein